LRIFGFSNFVEVVATRNLPVVFAVMAFWTGAGGWIIVMYGALNNIPTEVLEAARIDGCGRMQLALLIKIPLTKKWIAYRVILSIAGGTQVFVEPTLRSSASQGVVTPYWSPQELAYSYAFTQSNFNGGAAISVYLLVFALACAAVIVSSTGLFERS
jgi:multiple sugar transport system permease protein